jgi:hypothetical protein
MGFLYGVAHTPGKLAAHKKSHEGTLPPEGLQAFMALISLLGDCVSWGFQPQITLLIYGWQRKGKENFFETTQKKL